jgi:hypothetical protein
MKQFLILFFVVCSVQARAQCDYPRAKSAPAKPVWLAVELPPRTDRYYYDIGYGTGESYEKAMEKAIANIGKKRLLATGQQMSFDTVPVAKDRAPLTVKAHPEHEYWECCLDPVQRKYVYYLHLLCVVATNPSDDINTVITDKKYLQPYVPVPNRKK